MANSKDLDATPFVIGGIVLLVGGIVIGFFVRPMVDKRKAKKLAAAKKPQIQNKKA